MDYGDMARKICIGCKEYRAADDCCSLAVKTCSCKNVATARKKWYKWLSLGVCPMGKFGELRKA